MACRHDIVCVNRQPPIMEMFLDLHMIINCFTDEELIRSEHFNEE